MKTVFLFLLAASVAMAQTAKSRADLYTEIDTTLASGGNITAAELRGVFKNTVASGYNGLTDTEVTFGTINATTFNVDALNIGELSLSAYIASLGYLSAGGAMGAATATTPAENDNDTSVATTAYVQTEIAGISGLSGGMGALWPTADIATPPSGYFEAGLYGTTAQTALGSWSIVVKSLGTLATPTVSPAAGEIADGSTITFSSTDSGITFRHTTSGTDPTYTTGTTGATATLSGATTYEYIATKAGYPPSAVQSVAYTVPAVVTYANYLTLVRADPDFLSTPASTANRLGGSFEVVLKLYMDNWTSYGTQQNIIGRWLSSVSNNRSWRLRTTASTGVLGLSLSSDGTSATTYSSTTAHGFTNATAYWVKATFNHSAQEVKFFTAATSGYPDTGDWTQLGSTVTTTHTAISTNSVAPIYIGATDGLGVEPVSMRIYYAELKDGIGGTTVARFDASDDVGGPYNNVGAETAWTNSGGVAGP